MACTLQENEALPTAYPPLPIGLSSAARGLDLEFVWQRIESWTATRWTTRDVTFIVEGPGEWMPRLSPATISTAEIWRADAWESVTLSPSPLGGYVLDGEGPYRFTGTVGGGAVPVAAFEAFRRLAEYIANAEGGQPGLTSHSVSVAGISTSFERPNTWLARAMSLSGAADLLRPYRGVS